MTGVFLIAIKNLAHDQTGRKKISPTTKARSPNCVSKLKTTNNNGKLSLLSPSVWRTTVLGTTLLFHRVKEKEGRRRGRGGKQQRSTTQQKASLIFRWLFSISTFSSSSSVLNHLTMVQNKGAISETEKRRASTQRTYLHTFVFLEETHRLLIRHKSVPETFRPSRRYLFVVFLGAETMLSPLTWAGGRK